MGRKGTMRSLQAAARAAERDARRRQRELERRQKGLARMQELERARYEVQVCENRIDVLRSVHKECGKPWDWQSVKSSAPPVEPPERRIHERAARAVLEDYKPSIGDKVLRRADSTRRDLERAVEDAKRRDERDREQTRAEYDQEYSEWQSLAPILQEPIFAMPMSQMRACHSIG